MILSKWTTAVIAISTFGIVFLVFVTFIVPACRSREAETAHVPSAFEQVGQFSEEPPVDDSGFAAPVRMFGVDAGNTGFIQAPGVPAENRVYYRLAGGDATPVIAGDTVYCTGMSVGAFDTKSGREKWRFELPALPSPWAAVSDTAVYVACKKALYAIGRTSGQLLWKAGLRGELTCRPILVGDWIVAGTGKGIVGIDRRNGRPHFTFLEQPIGCLAAARDILFAGNKSLFAFDLRTLEIQWKKELHKSVRYLMAMEDGIYCSDWGNGLYKLAPDSGRQLWAIELQDEIQGLALAGRRIFSATADWHLMACDTESGKKVWQMALPIHEPLNAFAIAGERFYATSASAGYSQADMLVVVDIPTKKTVWRMEGFTGQPVIYGDMVFVRRLQQPGDGLVAIGPGSISSCTEMTSLQVCYDSVKQLYEQGDFYWKEAEILALKGLKQWPQGTISHLFESNIFKGAPYLLDILADIYRNQGKTAAALRCYRRMYREYRTDEFETGDSETQSLRYVCGAEGLDGQAGILREDLHDYEGAIQVAYSLMDEFGSKRVWGWEYDISYWWLAQDHIHQALEKINAPIERWEIEYRRLQSRALERPDVAALWMKLAGHFAKTNRFERAIALYNDVRKEFADFYRLSKYGDEVSCPALDACRELTTLYKMLKYPPGQQDGLADEIRGHEAKVAEILKKGQPVDSGHIH